MPAKCISELKISHDEKTAEAILQVVFEAPEAWGEFCRFTMLELEKIKSHLDGLFYRVSEGQYLDARNKYTDKELNLIDRLAGIGPNWEASEKGKARRAAIERDTKTAVEKLCRYIRDAEELFYEEAELQSKFDAVQERKKRFGHRAGDAKAMEQRFS